jgi:hypothetical protein
MKVDDVGTILIFTVTNPSDQVVDLTTATTATLCIDTGHVKSSHVMNFYNTTGGQVSYIIVAGDLPTTGVYKFEVFVEFAGGSMFTSSRTFDVVEPTLCP